MSLSNAMGPVSRPLTGKLTGKVLVGAAGKVSGEMRITDLEGPSCEPAWNAAVEAEYLSRVKAKATVKVMALLAQARTEAENIREAARLAGYNQGLAEGKEEGARQAEEEVNAGREELAEARLGMAEALAQALTAVQEGCRTIWDERRETLCALVRLCVEKVLAVELLPHRHEVLANHLDQAVELLDSRRRLNIRVHPEDEEFMIGLVKDVRDRYQNLDQWQIKPDASMTPGGIIVESDQGMVDNSVEGRLKPVREVLDQLSLPEEP